MKRSTVVILVVVGVVLVLFFWFKNGYNSMVKEQEGVQTAWSQVENVYQRRADLIPNLVNTVKGYAAHESQTLEGVVNARAKATQLTVDPENLTPEKLAAYQEAQGELGAALGKLLAIQENYPDLKANENFLALQSQLEGTENRISTERMKFNEAAKRYNVLIRVFPKSIIASLFGFEKMPYFQAKEGADVAPAVEF
ncbi:MAG: LemA family protein [Candidatus Egerieousia sp.]|jgi:LemA protein|nr:LemA family protein [bacterium]MDY2649778.1 LemA family protein [Candidatus Egerieousia sp.]MDD7072649.1 LemA family protein [bacterium]MDD7236313.1 LemA family protein [bacterium]MDY3134867.1 LemA family protein [Candidatus Egerieousia sp.]